MVGIQDWFNVYTGIRDAVNGLKADLAATQTALQGIKSSLTTDQGTHLDRLADSLGTINTKVTTLDQSLKSIAEAFGPGELGIELNIREQLSQLNETHSIVRNYFVPAEVGGEEGNLPDRLTALIAAIKEGTLPSTDLADAVTLLVTELTKPGSPSTLNLLGEYLKGILQLVTDPIAWVETTSKNMADSQKQGVLHRIELSLANIISKGTDISEPVLDTLAAPFRVVTEEALKRFRAALNENSPADPSKVTHVAATALTEAYQFGQRAHYMAVAAEIFPWFRFLGLPQMAAALGDLSGFRTVSQLVATSTLGGSITRPMRWANNDIFAPEILTIRDLYSLVHQRVIEIPRFVRGLQQQGFNEESVGAIVKGVWRQPTVRDLALAIEDTTVDESWLRERVRKAGYEDADADQLTSSLVQRALKAARGRVISAALANVTDGLLDTESYRTILESLQLRQDEIELQIRTAEISARRDTVNTAIGTYKRQYLNDVIDRNDFVLTLTALGVNPDRVDLIALDADAQRAPKIAREEEAKLKAAVREIQTELVPRYRRLYELGVIDEVAYENILIEAGISTQVAAQAVLLDKQKRRIVTTTAQATALERETARLVAETEEALRLQYRKGLIDETQLKNSLLDLGYTEGKAQIILNQERARIAPPPGKTIEAPAEAKARVLRDLAVQTALNDFRKGRIEVVDLYDELVAQGETEDEALARVNLEISRLPVSQTATP